MKFRYYIKFEIWLFIFSIVYISVTMYIKTWKKHGDEYSDNKYVLLKFQVVWNFMHMRLVVLR